MLRRVVTVVPCSSPAAVGWRTPHQWLTCWLEATLRFCVEFLRQNLEPFQCIWAKSFPVTLRREMQMVIAVTVIVFLQGEDVCIPRVLW